MNRRHLSQIGVAASDPPASDAEPGDVHCYPRPQLRRRHWTSLNGQWDFALDPDARGASPDDVAWTQRIEVPFSPATPRSGVDDRGLYRACWYRRTFELPMTPFEVDVSDLLSLTDLDEIVVRACDDPGDLCKPRGEQDWQLEPHSIWYPRTTGIWQTVWFERVPAASRSPTRASTTSATSCSGAPESPTLIDAEITLLDEAGMVLDSVTSYTALRSLAAQGDRFVLDGRLTREWLDVVRRDASHPCLVAWVPFNESWGVPNLVDSARERDYVQALYHLTRTLDPTRPVVGDDGWESVATDILGLHDYDASPARCSPRSSP